MAKRTLMQARRAPRREDVLRAAHQRAFDRMDAARWTPQRRRETAAAIEDLIDACEAYTRGA